MKLRFDRQSLRLRVRKSDLENIDRQGFIEEIVAFPGNSLTYRLSVTGNAVSVSLKEHCIEVCVPEATFREWVNSQEVGIYASVETGNPALPLQIMLEKDFPCQHGSAAENADTFNELAAIRKK